MRPTQRLLARKKNLLLCFDAFGTLFWPKIPITEQYAIVGEKYGINIKAQPPIEHAFKSAVSNERAKNPNYGGETGIGYEKWWKNVIKNTFQPYVNPNSKKGENVPPALVQELLKKYSTSEGYDLFPDVMPFFEMLRSRTSHSARYHQEWNWDKTVVGIITNSDARVPGILDSFGLKVGPRRVKNSAQRIQNASIKDDISFVVLSYDVGHEKPDKRIFDAASEMLKETLAEGGKDTEGLEIDDFEKLYVGDDRVKDFFGATRAGWNAVELDRNVSSDEKSTGIRSRTGEEGDEKTEVQYLSNLQELSGWSHELHGNAR